MKICSKCWPMKGDTNYRINLETLRFRTVASNTRSLATVSTLVLTRGNFTKAKNQSTALENILTQFHLLPTLTNWPLNLTLMLSYLALSLPSGLSQVAPPSQFSCIPYLPHPTYTPRPLQPLLIHCPNSTTRWPTQRTKYGEYTLLRIHY